MAELSDLEKIAASKIYLAADMNSPERLGEVLDDLKGIPVKVKVNSLGVRYSKEVFDVIKGMGKEYFRDKKDFDVRFTMQNYAYDSTMQGVDMMTIHAQGLRKMKYAVRGARQAVIDSKGEKDMPMIQGITVLTDYDLPELLLDYQPLIPGLKCIDLIEYVGNKERTEKDLIPELSGLYKNPDDLIRSLVVHRAKLVSKAGLYGIVCSSAEVGEVKKYCPELLAVVPGIKDPDTSLMGGQNPDRVATPGNAIKWGADYLVIGSAIRKSDDPRDAALRIVKDMVENIDYSSIIAKGALRIGAVKLSMDDPFEWASGYLMPIYINNRDLLVSPYFRDVVSEAMINVLDAKSLSFDLISGTPTGGIAPAASLSQKTGKDMIIEVDNKYYVFEGNLVKKVFTSENIKPSFDVVASTADISMVPGVKVANKFKAPFIYVRNKKKEYGMGQSVEGIINPGQRVLLIDYYVGNSYLGKAVEAIENKGGVVQQVISENVSDVLKTVNIGDKKVLEVEDHVSFGGSFLKRVNKHKDSGAEIAGIISNSNYCFPKTLQEFKQAGLDVSYVMGYSDIIKAAGELEDEGVGISREQISELEEWKEDHTGWGVKRGFPRYMKSKRK